ncbi:WG repeat-containing protein [Modicisalibacter radicis]|uniref:WG repeat-containing protein n=1 Tax=Halomonas sp. EAR18 TaxID=2518972 RepID=UPI00109D15BE|nr:WG repeat-containing protein [Halomonas sp. EAR18]
MSEPNFRGTCIRNMWWLLCMLCIALVNSARADVPNASEPPLLLPICVDSHSGTRCGLLQRNGEWAVTPRYEALYVRDDGWRFIRDDKSGLLHPDGTPWFDAKFEWIGEFHDGLALASRLSRQKKGFIDRQGNWVIEPIYMTAGPMVDDRAPVCRWIGGSWDGHSSCRYIDRNGKPAFDGEYVDAQAFKDGMAVIQPVGSDVYSAQQRRIGLIDRDGHTLIEPALRYALHVLGPDRLLKAAHDHYALIDRSGQTLFEVPTEGLMMSAGANMLAYRTSSSGLIGLRRWTTNEVVVPEEEGFATRPDFVNGTSTVLAPSKNNRRRPMLIDTQGQVLIEPGRYQSIGEFYEGVGPVTTSKGHFILVNLDNKTLTTTSYKQLNPAWRSAEQTYQTGDVWSATPIDALDELVWIDSSGKTLASREEVDCGVEVIRDGNGETIWPPRLDADCQATES